MSCSVTERVSSTPATVHNASPTSGTTSISAIGASTSSSHKTKCKEHTGPEGNSLSALATSPSSRAPAEGAETPAGVDGPPQNGPQSNSPQGSQLRSKPCTKMLLCCCCKCPWSNHGDKNDDNERTKTTSHEAESKISTRKGAQEEIRVSPDELRSWSKSFDQLMNSPVGRKVFRNFLKGEYSEENILFWLACEDFKKHTDKTYTEKRSGLIYMNYIHPDSSTEVSLDSRVREIVKKQLPNPHPSMYDEAQLQIYTLMQRDSYPRFLSSVAFRTLMEKANVSKPRDKILIYIAPQRTPSLHTIDLNFPQNLSGEHGQASQSTPLLTAVHPAATIAVSDIDRDQDAS
ncbi:regulator of G-protein signaling 19 isoform X1 [Dendroctonus ponderosae]|uniref:RGS domain-containing protein n=2 Tax=Dendroctonus ponderosae TaxID=77166 RepID=A0AAR5PIB8_DENPD|nr:regulator of G-protein signaling 19 isoform X1 [Dendroctonus ponderosae]